MAISILDQKYHQSKQIFFNHSSNTYWIIYAKRYIFIKHLDSLPEISMYKALTDQHEAVTLSNKLDIISYDISGCESDEMNE